MSLLCMGMVFAGHRELAITLLGRLDAVRGAEVDPSFLGWREMARASVSLLVRGHLGPALRHAGDAIALLDGARDPVGRAMATIALARAQTESGDFGAAQRTLLRAATMTDQIRVDYLRDWASVLLGAIKNQVGLFSEALELARPIAASGGPLTRVMAWVTIGNAHFGAGELDLAEEQAEHALEGSWPLPSVGARTVLARVALARDDPRTALVEAEAGLAVAERVGDVLLEGSRLRLVRAQALRALGDARAVECIRDARSRLERVAAGIDSLELRRVYLHELEPNARTFELAAAWCD